MVTLICDGYQRYAHNYYAYGCLAAQGLVLAPHTATLEAFTRTGQ